MTTARETYQERERLRQAMLTFLKTGPHEPKATPGEVMEGGCSQCGATPGQPCTGQFFWAAGMILHGFSGWKIHLRRYLDLTHDPR